MDNSENSETSLAADDEWEFNENLNTGFLNDFSKEESQCRLPVQPIQGVALEKEQLRYILTRIAKQKTIDITDIPTDPQFAYLKTKVEKIINASFDGNKFQHDIYIKEIEEIITEYEKGLRELPYEDGDKRRFLYSIFLDFLCTIRNLSPDHINSITSISIGGHKRKMRRKSRRKKRRKTRLKSKRRKRKKTRRKRRKRR